MEQHFQRKYESKVYMSFKYQRKTILNMQEFSTR